MAVFLAAVPSQSDKAASKQITATNWAPGLVSHFPPDHQPRGSQIVVEISPYEMRHTISSSSLYFSRRAEIQHGVIRGFLWSRDIVWVWRTASKYVKAQDCQAKNIKM